MSSEYAMPAVEVAEWVLYYPHEGAAPSPAMVTKVGVNCISLWVVSAGYGGVDRMSVHHKSDPGLKEFPDWARAGSWGHANTRYASLAEKVAVLERRLSELEGRKGK